jgi:hypothetical protein
MKGSSGSAGAADERVDATAVARQPRTRGAMATPAVAAAALRRNLRLFIAVMSGSFRSASVRRSNGFQRVANKKAKMWKLPFGDD